MEENKKYDQQQYNKNYREKNKEHVNYLRGRTAARSFIRNKATQEDLEELKELIRQKEIEIKEK